MVLAKTMLLPRPSQAPWRPKPVARDHVVAATVGILLAILASALRFLLSSQTGLPVYGLDVFVAIVSGTVAAYFALLAMRLALSDPDGPPFPFVRAAVARFSLLVVPMAVWGGMQGILGGEQSAIL